MPMRIGSGTRSGSQGGSAFHKLVESDEWGKDARDILLENSLRPTPTMDQHDAVRDQR